MLRMNESRVTFATVFGVVACAMAAFGGTVKVPLKAGWKFVKADDPAVGTNLTLQVMSGILDRAQHGDLAGAPDFAWAKPRYASRTTGAWSSRSTPTAPTATPSST